MVPAVAGHGSVSKIPALEYLKQGNHKMEGVLCSTTNSCQLVIHKKTFAKNKNFSEERNGQSRIHCEHADCHFVQ